MREANPKRLFYSYSTPDKLGHYIPAQQLREDSNVQAEAAFSGCEMAYCEVAKWNETTRRWERYAFDKCEGISDDHGEDMSCADEARMYASYINGGQLGQGFVHSMPTYNSEEVTT